MPVVVENVVRDVTRGGRVKAQALFAEDARTLAKERAGSTLRDARQGWLASKDGQRWLRNRKALDPDENMGDVP